MSIGNIKINILDKWIFINSITNNNYIKEHNYNEHFYFVRLVSVIKVAF